MGSGSLLKMAQMTNAQEIRMGQRQIGRLRLGINNTDYKSCISLIFSVFFFCRILYPFPNEGYDYYSFLCMLISPFGLVLGENSIVFTHTVEAR